MLSSGRGRSIWERTEGQQRFKPCSKLCWSLPIGIYQFMKDEININVIEEEICVCVC